jgi:hypothetical protein
MDDEVHGAIDAIPRVPCFIPQGEAWEMEAVRAVIEIV